MRQQRTGPILAGLAALIAVTLVLVAMALKHGTGVSEAAPTVTQPSVTSSPSSTTTAPATTAAIVGGAMTYADSSSGTEPGSRSWITYFNTKGVPKKLFMKDGLTTKQATAELTGGPYAVLTVATADDDYSAGRTGEQSAEDISALVSKAKVASGEVVVVAMSPASAVRGSRITTFNSALEQAVKAKGWTYCDAWASVRGDDGQWADESVDSVKNGNGASQATAKKVGPAVLACFSDASSSSASASSSTTASAAATS